MSLILAVEPDRRQAAQLTGVIRQHVGAELILADTTEGALVAIGRRVPDLVLVPALLAPQDDAALASALRVIAAAAHVRTLTIPVFSNGVRKSASKKGVLAKLGLGREEENAPGGCEPSVFAEQVIAYLKEAAEERQAAESVRHRQESEVPAGDIPGAVVEEPPADFLEPPVTFVEPAVAAVETAFAFEEAPAQIVETPVAFVETPVAFVETPVAFVEAPVAFVEAPVAFVEVPSESVEPVLEPIALGAQESAASLDAAAETAIDHLLEAPPEEWAGEENQKDDEEDDSQSIDLSDDLTVLCDVEDGSDHDEEDDEIAVYSLDLDPAFEVGAALEPLLDARAAAPGSVEATDDAAEDDMIVELRAAVDEPLPEPVETEWEDEPEFDDEPDSYLWMPLSLGPCWPPLHVTVAIARPEVAAISASAPGETTKPTSATDEGDAPKSEWVELIESLRMDIERLKTTPARKPATPVKTRPEPVAANEAPSKSRRQPAGKKRPPVQDEWGFFDPEQCGFAALLAKLDEITDAPDNEPAPRAR